MHMEDPQPVRFRLVLEITFPDADPWQASGYRQLLNKLKPALENTPEVNCKDVFLRASKTIGVNGDDDEALLGSSKYDFSSFSSGASYVFGVSYPVPAADGEELGKVWAFLSELEVGKKKDINFLVAVGQLLRPDFDAQAILVRTFFLRNLQEKKLVASGPSESLFEKAATIPLESRIEKESDLEALASLFG